MAAMIRDSRGKIMMYGGRARAAQQARFLRRAGGGNAAARRYIDSAARAYAEDGERSGWSYGQKLHNRQADA